MAEENQTTHKRRVRYSGKYPKKFEEKYKELQPEKYKDTIEHVIKKGNTPAGMHISIMVNEILDFLKIQPGETGFDATLGYGGHTKAMLQCLKGQGHIYATDVDPEESARTRKRLEEAGFGEDILTIRLQNFCTIDEIAKEAEKTAYEAGYPIRLCTSFGKPHNVRLGVRIPEHAKGLQQSWLNNPHLMQMIKEYYSK